MDLLILTQVPRRAVVAVERVVKTLALALQPAELAHLPAVELLMPLATPVVVAQAVQQTALMAPHLPEEMAQPE
jgi:hypothetical protein